VITVLDWLDRCNLVEFANVYVLVCIVTTLLFLLILPLLCLLRIWLCTPSMEECQWAVGVILHHAITHHHITCDGKDGELAIQQWRSVTLQWGRFPIIPHCSLCYSTWCWCSDGSWHAGSHHSEVWWLFSLLYDLWQGGLESWVRWEMLTSCQTNARINVVGAVLYKPIDKSQEPFPTYSDADHGGNTNHGKSTGGDLVKLGTGAISWSSKLQSMVALSTMEAEYISAVGASKEVLWMHQFMGEPSSSSILLMDNQSAISVSKNPEHHGRVMLQPCWSLTSSEYLPFTFHHMPASLFFPAVEGDSMSHDFLFCDIIIWSHIFSIPEGHLTCLHKPSKYPFIVIFSQALDTIYTLQGWDSAPPICLLQLVRGHKVQT